MSKLPKLLTNGSFFWLRVCPVKVPSWYKTCPIFFNRRGTDGLSHNREPQIVRAVLRRSRGEWGRRAPVSDRHRTLRSHALRGNRRPCLSAAQRHARFLVLLFGGAWCRVKGVGCRMQGQRRVLAGSSTLGSCSGVLGVSIQQVLCCKAFQM